MPNHPAMTGAMVVAGLAVAAAIAIYESSQARQLADDIRRKIAVALHSLGDEINPPSNNERPRFNRPEDSEGFFRSKAEINGTVCEADEESKRHQRREQLYWNAIKIASDKKEPPHNTEKLANDCSRAPCFEGISQKSTYTDKNETHVYSSGIDVAEMNELNQRKRGRVCSISDVNPFSNKHHIRSDSENTIDTSMVTSLEPQRQDVMSDIYNASDIGVPDISQSNYQKELEEPSVITDEAKNIYSSIHAWTETGHSTANPNTVTQSTLSLSSASSCPSLPEKNNAADFGSSVTLDNDADSYATNSGDVTPTDSCSVLSMTGEITWESHSTNFSEDVDSDKISLNGGSSVAETWSEIGSVVSENESL